MQPKLKAERELATTALRALMARRGITNARLAMLCGIDGKTMQVAIAHCVPVEMLRYRIENVLDFPPELWSSEREITVRKRCIREFGCDPRQLGLPELKAFCRKLGTGSPSVRTRENWFQLLVKWCERHPEMRKAAKSE